MQTYFLSTHSMAKSLLSSSNTCTAPSGQLMGGRRGAAILVFLDFLYFPGLPPEHPQPGKKVGLLLQRIYGTRMYGTPGEHGGGLPNPRMFRQPFS